MTDKKKKVLVVDNLKAWTRVKSVLEGQLDCEIDIFDKTGLAREALLDNGSYSLAIIDPYDWKIGGGLVEARVAFVRELQNKLPVLILTRFGSNVIERRCKLVSGEHYQAHVLRKYGYEKTLLEEMRGLLG